MADAVLVTVDDGIAVVTINRPEARNAVNGEVARAWPALSRSSTPGKTSAS